MDAAHLGLQLGIDICQTARPACLRHRELRGAETGATSALLPVQFEDVISQECTNKPVALSLRLATWNVLASAYALRRSFPDVHPDWLSNDARFHRVAGILDVLRTDIICLQEAEETHWLKASLESA